ncbi:hypothetical protein ACHAXT_001660 [Thalassiosira profunda]
MGRKSKKKGKAGARSNAAKSQPSATSKGKGAPPPGASCWICLDEEPDDAGQPLVRDCSCRGTSAGFAHLSCLIQYAEQKCAMEDQNQYKVDPFWMLPFMDCPNCKQKYQSNLVIEMATACVDFVEREQPDCLWRRMGALHFKLGALAIQRESLLLDDCEKVADEFFSIVEETKSNPSMFSLLPYVRGVEADVFMCLGNLRLDRGDEESGRRAAEYFEKAKELKVDFGLDLAPSTCDTRIAEAKALYEGKEVDLSARLKNIRLTYHSIVEKYGEGSLEAVNTGMEVATVLRDMRCVVEAERFLDKLAADSRRVLGPEHKTTEAVVSGLRTLRVRAVSVHHGSGRKAFQALRYDGSGKKLVVRGPIHTPRDAGKGSTIEVDTPVIPAMGTPVICHGLKSTPELNGKVGDVRGAGEGTAKGRILVHLEGRKKPVLVKPENLRIAFDLPELTVDESG